MNQAVFGYISDFVWN